MSPTQLIEIGDFPPELRESVDTTSGDWLTALAREADRRLAGGEKDIMESLSKSFEKTLIAKRSRIRAAGASRRRACSHRPATRSPARSASWVSPTRTRPKRNRRARTRPASNFPSEEFRRFL